MMRAAKRSMIRKMLRYGLPLLTIACLTTGCATMRQLLVRRELARLVVDLPEPPNSVLLSRAEAITTGADPRCDGYLISRLYGTNDPVSRIIGFVEEEILVQEGWFATPGVLEETTIGLRHEAGYRLSVGETQLSPELLESPFFHHKEIALDQPYPTIFEFTLVHSDPLYLEHCFGSWP